MVDLDDEDQANWYENQKEFINDNNELEIWGKVQHLDGVDSKGYPLCGEVSYLIFKGKLSEVRFG